MLWLICVRLLKLAMQERNVCCLESIIFNSSLSHARCTGANGNNNQSRQLCRLDIYDKPVVIIVQFHTKVPDWKVDVAIQYWEHVQNLRYVRACSHAWIYNSLISILYILLTSHISWCEANNVIFLPLTMTIHEPHTWLFWSCLHFTGDQFLSMFFFFSCLLSFHSRPHCALF